MKKKEMKMEGRKKCTCKGKKKNKRQRENTRKSLYLAFFLGRSRRIGEGVYKVEKKSEG